MNLKNQARNKTIKNFILFIAPAFAIVYIGWSYLNFAVGHVINLNEANRNLILWIWLFFLFASFALGWISRYFCTVTGFEIHIARMSRAQREIVIKQLQEANMQEEELTKVKK